MAILIHSLHNLMSPAIFQQIIGLVAPVLYNQIVRTIIVTIKTHKQTYAQGENIIADVI